VLYLYPAFVAILSAIVLKERIARRQIVALGVALAAPRLRLGRKRTVGRHPPGGRGGAITAVHHRRRTVLRRVSACRVRVILASAG